MSALRNTTNQARQALEQHTAETLAAMDPYELVTAAGHLRGTLQRLVQAVDHDRTARVNAQADEEFHNLVRAARLEIRLARNSLHRLNTFEKQLTRLLWGDDEVQP